MSAFLVDAAHIDYLLTFAQSPRVRDELTWAGHPDTDATVLGEMLWAENARSVAYRYRAPEIRPAYTFRRWPGPVNPVWVLKAIACYEYQSCEHPEWQQSAAYRIMRALEGAAIAALPGWAEAPWGIARDDRVKARVRV